MKHHNPDLEYVTVLICVFDHGCCSAGNFDHDSVPVKIDAVVYYKIFDAAKSIIAVENFAMASTLLAQSKLRDVLGKYDLDTVLSSKDQIGKEVLVALQGPTDEWGITIISVEIKNIEVPDNMKRAMAKEAEAIREKR